MKKMCVLTLAVFAAAGFWGCATGQALSISDLDEVGWDNTGAFQCYLSSALTLEKLPDDSAALVSFDNDGAAHVRDARWSIELPSSLEGRIVRHSKRDLYLYVAFEEGDAALAFAKDRDGRFSLITTIDDKYRNGVEFVEYEGFRYRPRYLGNPPYLNVVINRSQSDMRRQMQGAQARSVSSAEEAMQRASEKFIAGLPENATVALTGIASTDTETAAFVMDGLQDLLVNAARFKIVDRKSLDALYAERNFQYHSGDVDDGSMVSMGKMLGATIVITGDISGSGSSRRLSLKALDVQTSEILVTAREQL
jgi:TolB-like protein